MLKWIAALLAGVLLFASCAGEESHLGSGEPVFDDSALRGIEQRIGGRLGVALADAQGNILHSFRGEERFAMCSTFKLALSAAVLQRVETGEMAMADRLAFGTEDLLEYAPASREYVGRGYMTVEEAAEAISTLSDNTAANLLLDAIGGPEAMTAFFRTLGDDITRLDRMEPGLNENAIGDDRDTTSPVAMAGSVQRMMFSDILGEQARRQLADWTVANQTGDDRIRAGVPAEWRVGDKTGNCGNAYNDIGIVWPPNGEAFILTVYIDRATSEREEIDAAIAEIGELAAFYMAERHSLDM